MRSWNDRGQRGGAVGRIGREQDLAGGDEREQRLQVGRHPPGGVEQQVGVVARHPPDPRQVADRGVGEDDPRVGKLARELHGVAAQGRDAAAGVDQDREAALVGEGAQLAHRRVIERELLGAGMQLDALGARGERTLRLGERVAGVRAHPAERGQHAVGLRRRPRSPCHWRPGSRRARASGTRTPRGRGRRSAWPAAARASGSSRRDRSGPDGCAHRTARRPAPARAGARTTASPERTCPSGAIPSRWQVPARARRRGKRR